MDLTGLRSTAAGDIIGKDGDGVAYIGQVTTANSGTVFGVTMLCLETPAGGDPDINLHSATEATGVEDTPISDLTETLIINSGDLAAGSLVAGGDIAADQYLYLTAGATTDARLYCRDDCTDYNYWLRRSKLIIKVGGNPYRFCKGEYYGRFRRTSHLD